MKPGSPCRKCGEVLDGATETTAGTEPKAGDLSICAYCGELSLFTAAGTLEPLKEDELANMHPETKQKIKRVQAELIRRPIKARRPN